MIAASPNTQASHVSKFPYALVPFCHPTLLNQMPPAAQQLIGLILRGDIQLTSSPINWHPFIWVYVCVQKAGEADMETLSGELSSLWEAWQDRRRYFERLLNGCAVRASPCSGLKELAASISLTDAAAGF